MGGSDLLISKMQRRVQFTAPPTQELTAFISCNLIVNVKGNIARGGVDFALQPAHPVGGAALVHLKFDASHDLSTLHCKIGDIVMEVPRNGERRTGTLKENWEVNFGVINCFLITDQIASKCLTKFSLVMASGESLQELLIDAVVHTDDECRRIINGQ